MQALSCNHLIENREDMLDSDGRAVIPYICMAKGSSMKTNACSVQPAPRPNPALSVLLSDSRINTASHNPQEVKLCSGIKLLDSFLGGGLAFSTLVEWGMPFGSGARRLVTSFIARATTSGDDDGGKLSCLWISARPLLKIYPPAWQAAGVDLERLRFTRSSSPVHDLKPLFMDDFFKVIVLDHPTSLTLEDCGFITQCARRNRQLVIILRDHLLSTSDSNVWARVRLNTWRNPQTGQLEVEGLRGLKNSTRMSLGSQQTELLG